MSASAVFIMDTSGKIIISRNYRGDIPMTAAERFARILTEEEDSRLKPVIYEDGLSFMYITHSNLILMAMSKQNTNPLVILSFLSSLVEVLTEYFKELNEESLRDNFVITYELLDEVMDFGFPQSTDANILKEFICVTERHQFKRAVVPQAMTQRVSWRKEGIVHKKNEVFLDVVERLNLLVTTSGQVLRSEIDGVLKMRTFLSGMPELKLGLNDKILMDARARAASGTGAVSRAKSVEMEDIRFHQCVQLGRFENDRTISFIPPDGEFDLMSYRLNTQVRPLIWVEAHMEPHSSSRVEYLIKIKANYKSRSAANNVEILIPVPSDADSPTFKTSIGKVEYHPERDCIVWKIKTLQGAKDFMMRAQLGLPSVTANDPTKARPPIKVSFEIPYFTVSGIQVRYLKITEQSRYQALPWVRYITKNGDYEVRF
jgi:AP-1 complex subunit mu